MAILAVLESGAPAEPAFRMTSTHIADSQASRRGPSEGVDVDVTQDMIHSDEVAAAADMGGEVDMDDMVMALPLEDLIAEEMQEEELHAHANDDKIKQAMTDCQISEVQVDAAINSIQQDRLKAGLADHPDVDPDCMARAAFWAAPLQPAGASGQGRNSNYVDTVIYVNYSTK